MATTTLTLRLDAAEKRLLSDFAKTFGMSLSEFVRRAALERIEDELDLQAWEDAKLAHETNPQTLSADEVAAKYH